MVSDWFVVACRSFFSRGANLTVELPLSLQQDSLHYNQQDGNHERARKKKKRRKKKNGRVGHGELFLVYCTSIWLSLSLEALEASMVWRTPLRMPSLKN
jgi:hypothetical protein